MTTPEPGTPEYEQAFAERAAEQERRHDADPQHEPLYLPADEPGFETEAYTAGGPEEQDA
jgi:hypothetical protein